VRAIYYIQRLHHPPNTVPVTAVIEDLIGLTLPEIEHCEPLNMEVKGTKRKLSTPYGEL